MTTSSCAKCGRNPAKAGGVCLECAVGEAKSGFPDAIPNHYSFRELGKSEKDSPEKAAVRYSMTPADAKYGTSNVSVSNYKIFGDAYFNNYSIGTLNARSAYLGNSKNLVNNYGKSKYGVKGPASYSKGSGSYAKSSGSYSGGASSGSGK